MPQTFNFIKKRLWHRCFPCAFCKISKNTFLTEHFWTTASAELKKSTWRQSCIYIVKFISFWLYTHFYMNNFPLKLNVIIVEQILRLKFFLTCSLQMLSLPFFCFISKYFLAENKVEVERKQKRAYWSSEYKKGCFRASIFHKKQGVPRHSGNYSVQIHSKYECDMIRTHGQLQK